MKLALDHHYPRPIAQHLRDLGHDVVAAIEVGWNHDDDDTLLDRCSTDDRALLTNNVADFAVLGRTWPAEGRSHAGLIFTSDRGWPRTRDNIGAFVNALDELMRANPEGRAFADRTHWL